MFSPQTPSLYSRHSQSQPQPLGHSRGGAGRPAVRVQSAFSGNREGAAPGYKAGQQSGESNTCALPRSGEVFAQGHGLQKILAGPPSPLASRSQLLRALTSPLRPSSELISWGLHDPRSGFLPPGSAHSQEAQRGHQADMGWAPNYDISFPFHRRKKPRHNTGQELASGISSPRL